MPLQLLDGEDKVRDHLILLAPFDLKQQKPVSLRIMRLLLSGFNMLSIPKAASKYHNKATSRQDEEKQSAQQLSNKEFTGDSC